MFVEICLRCGSTSGVISGACGDCRLKELARIELSRVRGFWAARVNNLIAATGRRWQDTPEHEDGWDAAYIRVLKKELRAWAQERGVLFTPGIPNVVDETEGSWSDVVRAMENS